MGYYTFDSDGGIAGVNLGIRGLLGGYYFVIQVGWGVTGGNLEISGV